MKSFRRIFKYVWPQWPRVIIVVLCAMIVSVLLSLSFVTIIPLLKVIMGQEGLHGWVDRKSCEWRYGMDFYVPDITDLTSNGNQDFACSLLITRVVKEGLAEKAGFKVNDRIVGAGKFLISPKVERIPFTKLFEEMATTAESKITVQLKRISDRNILEDKELRLITPLDEAYFESIGTGGFDRWKCNVKIAVVDRVQSAISILPRDRHKENQTKAVVFIIVAIGVVTVIRCFAKFTQDYLAEKVVQVGINRLRDDAYEHVLSMPLAFFSNERPSDVVSRLVGDTVMLGKVVKIMLGKALREPLNVICFLTIAMILNWQLTLIFLCGAPFALGLVAILGKKMKKAATKSLMAWSQMLAKLQETLAGLKVVKVYNQQEYERTTFSSVNSRLLKQLLKISKVDAATMPVLEVLGIAAGSAALIVGAHWVSQNKIEPAQFMVLLILLGSVAEATRKTSDIWNKIQEANAAAERVFAIVDEPIEIEKAGAITLEPMSRQIEFRNVVFNYPGMEKPALKGINLAVKAGHNVALVGPNGSGKTTLANLIPRFYDPDSGQILIDGKDIRGVTLFSLRNQIGMVTQNVVTFNDTIAANIAYGKSGATMEEIIAAAKRAFAHEFIEPLPGGYDTVIGEQGLGLSGGQLQRVVIARAILKNPAILIFDEATSQVDADSEAKIHSAIEEMMQYRTSFVIAHRFSTIVTADVIVVMDDGRIVAQGQHYELMQTCPLYRSLYETQLVKA